MRELERRQSQINSSYQDEDFGKRHRSNEHQLSLSPKVYQHYQQMLARQQER